MTIRPVQTSIEQSVVLRALYSLEENAAQSGDLNTWFTPLEISQALRGQELDIRKVTDILTELWTQRQILQVTPPDTDIGASQRPVADSYGHPLLLEINDVRSHNEAHKTVAVPETEEGILKCKYRSRTAEIRRLLSFNYQRYDMRPSSALVRTLGRRQLRAIFDTRVTEVRDELCREVHDGSLLISNQTFKLDGRINRKRLADSISDVLSALHDELGPNSSLAGFQRESLRRTLAGLYSPEYRKRIDGHVITAGVGSGKTYAFQIAAVIHAVHQKHRGILGVCCLLVYPRVVLAQNQIIDLTRLIAAVRRRQPSLRLANPVLDAGGKLAQRLNTRRGRGALIHALKEAYTTGGQLVVSNLETLANRLGNPLAGPNLTSHLDLIVVDEAHLLSGVYGANARALLARIFAQGSYMRKRSSSRAGGRSKKPYVVGASATIAEPKLHLARLATTSPRRIAHVTPGESELARCGYIHHLFLRQYPNMSSLSAATNAASCLLHNRRDGLHIDYYQRDGAALGLSDYGTTIRSVNASPRQGSALRKSLAFSNSLDAVNRWADLIADNERSKGVSMYKNPRPRTLPYFARFTEPLWRLVHLESFSRTQPKWRLKVIRHYGNLCFKCKKGVPHSIQRVPDSLPTGAQTYLQELWAPDADLSYLSKLNVSKEDRRALRFSAIANASLQNRIKNLDECAFFISGLCWWWSESHLGSNSPDDISEESPLNGLRKRTKTSQRFLPLSAIRVSTATSKKSLPEVRDSIDDIFEMNAGVLLRTGGTDNADKENVGLLIGSPRLEVGVDLRNVTEGITYRTLQNPAGVQQKVGRIGREKGADSLIVHVVTESTREQYYLRNPELLLDHRFLQPIPLHENNLLIRRHHYYMAAFDFIACLDPSDTSPGLERLFLVNDPDFDEGPRGRWNEKLKSFLDFLFKGDSAEINRQTLEDYLKQLDASQTECEDVLNALYEDFCETLSWQDGSFSVPEIVADYMREPWRTAPADAPLRVRRFVEELPKGAKGRSYLWQLLGGTLFGGGNLSSRPFCWASSLFEVSGKQSIQILFARNGKEDYRLLDTETVSASLSLLAPGTVTYRYHQTPDKVVLSIREGGGHAVAGQAGVVLGTLDTRDSQTYEKVTDLKGEDFPDHMYGADESVAVYRPRRIFILGASSAPHAFIDGTLADGDEADWGESAVPANMPPKCFPVRWYRVKPVGESSKPRNRLKDKYNIDYGWADQPICTLFQSIGYHAKTNVTEFIWALDRQFANRSISNSRLYYRDEKRSAVALGHDYETAALSFTIDLSEGSLMDSVATDITTRSGTAAHQAALIHGIVDFIGRHALDDRQMVRKTDKPLKPSPFATRDILKIICFAILENQLSADGKIGNLAISDVQHAINSLTLEKFGEIATKLAQVQVPDGARERARVLLELWPNFSSLQRSQVELTAEYIKRVTTDILINSLGIATLAAALRVSGADDSDMKYFCDISDGDEAQVYLFDSDEGGNGAVDVVLENFYVSAIEHTLQDRKAALSLPYDPIPDTCFVSELEKELSSCDMMQVSHIVFHESLPTRHVSEDLVESERSICSSYYTLAKSNLGVETPDSLGLLQSCSEFIWHECADVLPSQIYPNFQALELASRFCFDGCTSCLVAPEYNVHGPLMAVETVSKILLDFLFEKMVERSATALYPSGGATVSAEDIPKVIHRTFAKSLDDRVYEVALGGSHLVPVQPSLTGGSWSCVLRPDGESLDVFEERYRVRMGS